MSTRVVELEKSVYGWPATEPDFPRVEDGDPEHVVGKLEMLEHRAVGLRADLDDVEGHLAALITVVKQVVARKLGVEIMPAFQDELAKVKRAAREEP